MWYTKGPWRVVEANTPGVLYIDGPAQKLTIITSAIDLDFSDYVNRTSDAHLIAAAPCLLEALEDIIKRNEIQSWFNLDKARAAVAKAKGES